MQADEALPDICGGLPQVGEAMALVGWAPDAAGGVVEVTAGEELELTAAEHEVEGKQRRALEVVVHAGQDVKVGGVKPKLAGRGLGAGAVPAGEELTHGEADLGKQAELVGEGEG